MRVVHATNWVSSNSRCRSKAAPFCIVIVVLFTNTKAAD
jgi:hypothetical protein